MHFSLTDVIGVLAVAVGGWLGHRITSPKAHERANVIALIARDAAALVVSLNPKGDWATLLKQVVDQIATSAGTENRDAIERAAASALTSLGKNPGVNA